ncbi:MAG: PilZ domain-containing protein, partial [Deltaproteobacteria bacterium]|nr:PilZ domain-containing protein [Deltaproteobacteria bacterium]
ESQANNPLPITDQAAKPKQSIKFIAAVDFRDGEVILAPGKAQEKLFVLMSGEVKVATSGGGKEVVLFTAKAGDVIGELPGLSLPAGFLSFTAVGPVKLGVINPAVLTSEAAQLPVTTKYALKKLFIRQQQLVESLFKECNRLYTELVKKGGLPSEDKGSGKDNRIFVRRKVGKTLVQFRTFNGEFHGYILDLSGGGMGILTRADHPADCNIEVSFALPQNEKEISAKGKIMSSIKVKNGYRLGVKFTEFGYGAEKALKWFTFNFPPEEKA